MNTNLSCPECNSNEIIKAGCGWSGRYKVQKYLCKNCGRIFGVKLNTLIIETKRNSKGQFTTTPTASGDL
jgi:transposase-like protein